MGIITSLFSGPVKELFFLYQSKQITDNHMSITFPYSNQLLQSHVLNNGLDDNGEPLLVMLFHLPLKPTYPTDITLQIQRGLERYETVFASVPLDRSLFLYDVSFNAIESKEDSSIQPGRLNNYPSHFDQFNYLINFLRTSKASSALKTKLLQDSITFLTQYDSFSFEFFLSIYLEVYNTPFALVLLRFFSPLNLKPSAPQVNLKQFEHSVLSIKEEHLYQKSLSQYEKTLLIDHYELINLYYHYTVSPLYFSVYLESSARPQTLLEIILSLPQVFNDISFNSVVFLANFAQNREAIEGAMRLLKCFYHLCLFIKKLNKKLSLLFEEAKSLDINAFIKVDSTDNITEILNLLSKFTCSNYAFLKMNYAFIKEYITMFTNTKICNLYLIKVFLIELTSKGILNEANKEQSKQLIESSSRAIHLTGVGLIQNKAITAIDCLDLFLADELFFNCSYEEFNYIITHISDESISEISQIKNGFSSCWTVINAQLDNEPVLKATYGSQLDIDIDHLAKVAAMMEIAYNKMLFSLNKGLLLALIKFYCEYEDQTVQYKAFKEFSPSESFFLLIKDVFESSSYANLNDVTHLVLDSIVKVIKGMGASSMIRDKVMLKYFPSSNYKMNKMKMIISSLKQRTDVMLIADSPLLQSLLAFSLSMNQMDFVVLMKSQLNEKSFMENMERKMKDFPLKDKTVVINGFGSFSIQVIRWIRDSCNKGIEAKGDKSVRLKEYQFALICNDDEFKTFEDSFVNQFEVHMVSWRILLAEEEINECKELLDIITNIAIPEDNSLETQIKSNAVNCLIDDILILKYFNKSLSKDELLKLVLSKIAPLFSQDTIVLINNSIFKANHPDLTTLVFSKYSEGKHQNLSQYLSSIPYSFSVIYTFSGLKEQLAVPEPLLSTIQGDIQFNSLAKEQSKEARNEHDYDILIHSFYSNQKNLLVIRLASDEANSIEHIRCLIRNYEVKTKVKEKKYFVFIVHLQREQGWRETMLVNKLSRPNLFMNGISIDNLNGKDVIITDLINRETKEVIGMQSFMNWDQVYNDIISQIRELIEFICHSSAKAKDLKGFCDTNELKVKKEAIDELKNKKGWIASMLNSTSVEKCTDLISEICLSVEEKYIYHLIRVIIKQHFNDKVTLSDDIRLTAVASFNANVISEAFREKVALIQGVKYSQLVKDKYSKSEDCIRRSNSDDNKSSSKAVNDFILKEKYFSEAIQYEVAGHKDIQAKSESINDNMLYYCILFLTNKCSVLSEELQELLSSFISLRYSQDTTQLGRNILWMESNADFIQAFIKLACLFERYHPNAIQSFIKSMQNEDNTSELFSNFSNYKKSFVKPFFIPLQALITMALRFNEIIEKLNQQDFEDYLTCLREIDHKGRQLQLSMQFDSFELNVLQNFLEVIDCMKCNNTYSLVNVIAYLKMISQGKEMKTLNIGQELITNMHNLLSTLISQTKGYPRVMTNILINNFTKFNEESNRKAIAQVLITTPNVLAHSDKLLTLFFKLHLVYSSFSPNEALTTFKSLSQSKEFILEPFDKAPENVKALLFAFFLKKFHLFFNEQPSIHDKLFETPLELFKHSLQCIEDIKTGKANSSLSCLTLIYSFAYAKVYLMNYINALYSLNSEVGDCSGINAVIEGDSDSQLRKIVKLFILKLFQIHLGSLSKMKQFDWEIHQIGWVSQFSFDNLESNFDLLSVNAETKEQYDRFFSIEQLPSVNELKTALQSSQNSNKLYPVLTEYLKCKDIEEYSHLPLLSSINPFVNYMIDTYSYYTSRKEANSTKLSQICESLDVKKAYELFKSKWNLIGNARIEDSSSICVLINDSKDAGLGKELYDTYVKYISLQNNFLNNILLNWANSQSRTLSILFDSIREEITIQKATSSEFVSLEINHSTSEYHSFDDLILSFYSTSNGFDCNSIEEELQLLLLTGKKLFSTQQKTVTFAYENLMTQPSLNSSYVMKYPQNDSNANKPDCKSTLSSLRKSPNSIGNVLMAITQIIPAIQMGNYPQRTQLKDIIDSLPLRFPYQNQIKEVLNRNTSLNVNNVVTFYEMLEASCLDAVKEAFSIAELSNEKKRNIDVYFTAELKKKGFTKRALAESIMRFISSQKEDREAREANSKMQLFEHINKKEYWDGASWERNGIQTEMNQLNRKVELYVDDAFPLYYHLIKESDFSGKEVTGASRSRTVKKGGFSY